MTYRRREDLRKGAVGWWLQPARRGWIAVLFLLLIVTMILLNADHFRIIGDERSTCQIQARGLPAGHELAASMRDIHILLTLPRPAGTPAPAPAVIVVVRDLNKHLALYLAAENTQPATRRC